MSNFKQVVLTRPDNKDETVIFLIVDFDSVTAIRGVRDEGAKIYLKTGQVIEISKEENNVITKAFVKYLAGVKMGIRKFYRQFQKLKEAILIIAHDNGVINRTTDEEQFLEESFEFFTENFDIESLKYLDSCLRTLDLAELDEVCRGEESEISKIVAMFENPTIFNILDDLFNRM